MLKAFVDAFSTLTLATTGPDGPWAAALFFARDEALNLYFISSPKSRHVRNLGADRRVCVTVNGDHDDWFDIRGLQIDGVAEYIAPAQRDEVAEYYLSRFSDLRRIVSEPGTAAEHKIAAAFQASEFIRVRPQFIRLIDNTRGFGTSIEFVLEAGSGDSKGHEPAHPAGPES
ncbi:pyridoxamine 5'-phosphate oxidase family protein [Elongatibacter sediminis]|uniref:Pyridoxamine 5'-phosphate oxidase family protein n=1 Tax=Elongatibacter sediminis TaxID=3119006 RepID=A0AAW9RN10_9GAMM